MSSSMCTSKMKLVGVQSLQIASNVTEALALVRVSAY
jgi:hypothetical protein